MVCHSDTVLIVVIYRRDEIIRILLFVPTVLRLHPSAVVVVVVVVAMTDSAAVKVKKMAVCVCVCAHCVRPVVVFSKTGPRNFYLYNRRRRRPIKLLLFPSVAPPANVDRLVGHHNNNNNNNSLPRTIVLNR